MHKQKNVAVNKKARFDYFIEDTFEAGMVLVGSEVKSLREGRVNIKDGYVRITEGEAFLIGVHINTYPYAHQFNHEPERDRKLLLHKREIQRLYGKVREKGLTLVPLRIYFRNGKAKLEFGLAKGKKAYDRREDLKTRTARREISQAMRAKLR